jgi:hypothetical protein
MDPLTALSLASAVVQFVDFGIKVFSKGNEIHQSATGSSVENTEINDNTETLHTLLQNIQDSQPNIPSGTKLPSEQESLNRLVWSCRNLGNRLLDLTEKTSAGPNAGRWKSVGAAVSAVWSAKDIMETARRLDRYRDQLNFNIVVSLRYTC